MLSIIIVNYNVKYFLEQCLYSVRKATSGIVAEIIVVDNNSPDESVAYLQHFFPDIIFISNTVNTGYAKANNQGLKHATGDYILFLNPDTILGEDCLRQSICLLEKNPVAGALGIRMIDGSGHFLPESKRGLPTPWASFFKLSGLIHLFPRSKTIAQYYAGHLPDNVTAETDILAGAYMMIKKEVLQKIGGFDEQFFMYGEDIDLSYRIKKAGYKNYYLAGCSIVHFKGESTNKNIDYTRMFYKAMRIFVEKHYGKKSWSFNLFLQAAIVMRQLVSFVQQPFSKSVLTQQKGKALHTIIVGETAETKKLAAVLNHNQPLKRAIVMVGSIGDINGVMEVQKTDEIIFCADRIGYNSIIKFAESLDEEVEYKFFAAGSNSIVGSASKNKTGEVVVIG